MTAVEDREAKLPSPFSVDELEARRNKLRDALDGLGVAAAVISSESNIRYFTGIETPSFASNSRPAILVLHADGESVLFVAAAHVPHARRWSNLSDIRGFDGFEKDGVDSVLAYLDHSTLRSARLGFELGNEMRAGMTHGALSRMLAARAGPDVDVSSAIWPLRLIKSPAEIGLMRAAGRMGGVAYDRMIEAIRVDVTDRQLFQVFASAAIREGADRVGYFAIHSGDGSDRRPNAPPEDRALTHGDLVWVDAGVVFHGYWSDFTRMVSLGAPSTERRDSYEFVYKVSRELLSAIRPGLSAASLMALATDSFGRAGRAIGNSSRIGHGLGLEITEPPSIIGSDRTVLTQNMALAVEPAVSDASGYFVVEENFVLTAEGVEALSPPCPPDLPVVE